MHSKSVNFADDYIRTVQSLQQSYKCGKVVIARDGGSSSYRKALYPAYKANRAEKYETQTEMEKKQFEAFLAEFNKTMELIAEKFPVVKFDKVEADDIAAYICGELEEYDIEEVWLISSDRDWDLMVNEKVSRFSYVTRKEITIDNWHTHYEYTPEDHISIKCLMGDSGDNVDGVDGIGPKRAIELVKQYGTALDIVANLPIASKYKYIQSLNKCGDLIMLNYQLMDLPTFCADAIGKDNCKELDKILQQYLKDN